MINSTDSSAPPSTPLDWQRVARATAGQTIGRRLVYLPITGSTNDVAAQLAAEGAPEGVVVFAEAQTAGRGRAGKSPWLMPPYTSVALSAVLRPRLAPGYLPWLAMAAGVATVQAITATTAVVAALKWPNDVVSGDRKLGGIIVESAIGGAGITYAILGIGINGNFAAATLGPLPDATVLPTTLQDEAGVPIVREDLLLALLRELDRVYATVKASGIASIWPRYRAGLSTLGRTVRVWCEPAPVEGRAEDVTQDGSLVVRLASGERRTFSYGEVTVRPAG